METNELKEAWHSYDDKLERLWALNLRSIKMVQTQKATAKLQKLANLKMFMFAIGVAYVLILAVLIYTNRFVNPYFCISVACILLLTLYAMMAYVKQLRMIRQINYDENIVHLQKKLVTLQLSTLKTTRIV